ARARTDGPCVAGGLREEAGVRAVAMTTNGLVLTRRLPALQRAGLSALNVSLDSLRADRYERMARRPAVDEFPLEERAASGKARPPVPASRACRAERVRAQGLARVLAGVDLALQLGYSPVKINVVLMKGKPTLTACAPYSGPH
ncbi:hypothetical protein HF086_005409, partial [Spodoptera exigua]